MASQHTKGLGPIVYGAAEDVLGRGIDFPTCRYVILYEYPTHKNGKREYVHRVGRTGRAGREGFAITLLEDGQTIYIYVSAECR